MITYYSGEAEEEKEVQPLPEEVISDDQKPVEKECEKIEEDIEIKSKSLTEESETSQEKTNTCVENQIAIVNLDNVSVCLEQVHIEVGERVKLKRRKKKRSHNTQEQPATEVKSSTKHKRKKHKHGEHSTKKYVCFFII